MFLTTFFETLNVFAFKLTSGPHGIEVIVFTMLQWTGPGRAGWASKVGRGRSVHIRFSFRAGRHLDKHMPASAPLPKPTWPGRRRSIAYTNVAKIWCCRVFGPDLGGVGKRNGPVPAGPGGF